MAELLADHLKGGQVKDKQSGQDLTRIPPYPSLHALLLLLSCWLILHINMTIVQIKRHSSIVVSKSALRAKVQGSRHRPGMGIVMK